MNLDVLLRFLPFAVAAFLAYHLVFKQGLAAKGIGAILSYFVGIIIIFGIASWLITNFLAGWTYRLVQEGSTDEWQDVINASGEIVEDAFGLTTSPSATQPTPLPVAPAPVLVVTATPTTDLGSPAGEGDPALIGPTSYTVVTGDTLYSIAERFKTTVNDIMIANGLTSYTIHPDQVLQIPAPSN
jgi:LysM repeat protein